MNADNLHDAISLLPEELLTPVDRLRQKKRIPWGSVAALAACLCLVVGLWLFFPGDLVAMDSANGGIELGEPAEENQYSASVSESLSSAGNIAVTVVSIPEEENQIICRLSGAFGDAGLSAAKAQITVSFENLEQIPTLKPEDTIRIYYKPEQFDTHKLTVKPYQIEMIKEETK